MGKWKIVVPEKHILCSPATLIARLEEECDGRQNITVMQDRTSKALIVSGDGDIPQLLNSLKT